MSYSGLESLYTSLSTRSLLKKPSFSSELQKYSTLQCLSNTSHLFHLTKGDVATVNVRSKQRGSVIMRKPADLVQQLHLRLLLLKLRILRILCSSRFCSAKGRTVRFQMLAYLLNDIKSLTILSDLFIESDALLQ